MRLLHVCKYTYASLRCIQLRFETRLLLGKKTWASFTSELLSFHDGVRLADSLNVASLLSSRKCKVTCGNLSSPASSLGAYDNFKYPDFKLRYLVRCPRNWMRATVFSLSGGGGFVLHVSCADASFRKISLRLSSFQLCIYQFL